jgi:hypothetical protein
MSSLPIVAHPHMDATITSIRIIRIAFISSSIEHTFGQRLQLLVVQSSKLVGEAVSP